MDAYEIEIKSLLGEKARAEQLIESMKRIDPKLKILGSHKQLNHYFVSGDLLRLYKNTRQLVERDKQDIFARISRSKNYSVRTADRDGKILLVIKASVDDTTSANGIARMEFEAEVKLSLDELDKLVLDSGFQCQAKWSRERQEFKYKDLDVSIDKNAGYGYLAEFEKVIDDPSKVEEIKTVIRDCMQVLGLEELPQDRLERMFDYYNKNWQDYYGTDKTFKID